MGCTSVYSVLAVVLHALPTGGTRRSSSALQHYSNLIDGFLTGKLFNTLNLYQFQCVQFPSDVIKRWGLCLLVGFAAGMTSRMNDCRRWRRMRRDYIDAGLFRIARLPAPKASILQTPFTRWRLGICFRCLWRRLRACKAMNIWWAREFSTSFLFWFCFYFP